MRGKVSLVVLVSSFLLYVFDVISDIYVAVQYYNKGEWWWFRLTLSFIIVPHVIINTHVAFFNAGLLYSRRHLLLMWIFQMSIITSFKKEFIRWKRENWDNVQTTSPLEKSNAVKLSMHHAFLRLAEAFGESAPQWCLQNYIMIHQWSFPWYTVISTVASLLSMSWSVTSLEKAKKTADWSQENKNERYPKRSLVVFLVWQLSILISRLSALVVFAYVFRYYVFIVVGMHWFLVFVSICIDKWIYRRSRGTLQRRFEDALLGSLLAYSMIFNLSGASLKLGFFSEIVMKSRRTFTFIFYSVLLLENSVMVSLSVWYEPTRMDAEPLGKIAVSLVFGGFFLGVLFLGLYYRCCHPMKIINEQYGPFSACTVINGGLLRNDQPHVTNEMSVCYETAC